MIIYMHLITYEMLVYIGYKSIMANNLSLRSILDANKLIGLNFIDWFQIIKIVLKQEKRLMSFMILFLRSLMRKLLIRKGRLIEFIWMISILQHA